jgi:phage-related protein
MAVFTWVPDKDAAREAEAKVLSAGFGDNYSQDLPDGINSVSETWDLAFTVRSLTEIKAIEDFLAAQKGSTYFTWTTPRADTLKFKCTKWKATYRTPTDNSLTCTFKQTFQL